VAKMNSKCLTKVSEQERESCEENSQKKWSMALIPWKDNCRAEHVKIKEHTSPHVTHAPAWHRTSGTWQLCRTEGCRWPPHGHRILLLIKRLKLPQRYKRKGIVQCIL
jgi:hypothetical protein